MKSETVIPSPVNAEKKEDIEKLNIPTAQLAKKEDEVTSKPVIKIVRKSIVKKIVI